MGYPHDALYREMAFLAYYLHWDYETLLNLEHAERRRWCAETSAINRQAMGDVAAGRRLEDF
jgi:hypothetical protein